MEKVHFSIHINAPREKVWNTMLNQETYRVWTEAFNPGSYYEGDWNEGSTIHFIGPDPRDPTKNGGLVSKIVKNVPFEFISIEHVGLIQNGVEDFNSDLMKEWAGAHENYTFTDKDGGTLVEVDLDVTEKEKHSFDASWPAALVKLKEISEK
jgi:hypothetical protein